MKKQYLLSLLLAIFVIPAVAQRLVVPETTKIISKEEAVKTIELILNSQVRNDISGVFVSEEFYRVGIGKKNQMTFTSSTKSHLIRYDEIGSFLIIEHSNRYNLIVQNKKGKEIDKVLCPNLKDVYRFVDCIRNLQGIVK